MYKSLFMDMEFTPKAQDASHPFEMPVSIVCWENLN